MNEKDDRRKAILKAASRLFAEQGVDRTTTREIADAAGMVSGSLYHYYPAKTLIVQEILKGTLDELMSAYRQGSGLSPLERLRELIQVSLEVAYAHPHNNMVFQWAVGSVLDDEGFEFLRSASADLMKPWIDALDEGVEMGLLRPEIPRPVVFRMIRDAVWLSGQRMESDDDEAVRGMTDLCTSVFLRGLAA